MEADERLMAGVAAGDAGALAELCRRWERPLLHFLARQTGARDVEDLYQDVWLRVVRAAPRFDPARRFRPWLFQIAVNRARDRHRRRRTDPLAGADARLPDVGRVPATEAALDADRLLAALPESQRSVVVLRYGHDLSEAEIAEALGCPPGTVKSRLHTALTRLAGLVRAEGWRRDR